ncbi:uncharacterized protein PG998_007861 [Apiospora kogelbergensis]|uniref:uncharacterized protein n=1 Tax=Apiospora kogelbergensis TaxID=1337665 RepID=UPI00312DC294
MRSEYTKRIFNGKERYRHSHRGEPEPEASFSFFPRLPPEIRVKIFLGFLERHRIIQVRLSLPSPNAGSGETGDGAPPYTARNHLGNVVSGDTYRICASKYLAPSVLFSVSHEARDVARRFYRVKVPCYLYPTQGSIFPFPKPDTTFLYNPDFDILHIQYFSTLQLLVDFVHDVRAHDHKGIGILNLALHIDWDNYTEEVIRGPGKTAFTETLETLASIWFELTVYAGARVNQVPGERADQAPGECADQAPGEPSADFHYNRSVPLYSGSKSFDRLARDPRDIDPDLKHVCRGRIDSGFHKSYWQSLVKSFGVQRTTPVDIRLMVGGSMSKQNFEVVDRRSLWKLLAEPWRWSGHRKKPATNTIPDRGWTRFLPYPRLGTKPVVAESMVLLSMFRLIDRNSA